MVSTYPRLYRDPQSLTWRVNSGHIAYTIGEFNRHQCKLTSSISVVAA